MATATREPIRSLGRQVRLPEARGVGLALTVTCLAGAAAIVVLELAQDQGFLFTPNRARLFPVLLGVFIAAVAVPARRLPWVVAAGIATWVTTYLLFEAIPDAVEGGNPVDQAVGGGAFYDTPYGPQQLAALAIMATIVGGTAVAVVVLRRWRHRLPVRAAETWRDETPPAYAVRRRRWLLAGGTALVWLTLVPDLPVQVSDAGAPQLTPHWDVGLSLAWQDLADRGLVPMRDFFYPYGHAWVYETFPMGPVWKWLGQGVMLALCAWSLWRLSGGRPVRVLLCLVAVALVGAWEPGLWRYLPGFLVATSYAALGPARHTRPTWGHAVFASALLLAGLTEADLVLLGLAGAGFVLVGELLSGRLPWRPSRLVRGLAIDALPLAILLVVPAVWLATGTFEGNARFFFGLRATSAASTPNEDLAGALVTLSLRPKLENVLVAIPGLLAMAGLIHCLVRRRPTPGVDLLLLGAAGVALVLEMKHLVRTHSSMLAIPSLALAWTAILVWTPRRLALSALAGVFAGVLIAGMERDDVASTYAEKAVDSPIRAVDGVEVLTDDRRVDRVRRLRFAPSRFDNWPEKHMAVELRTAMGALGARSFAVLGDVQLLYTLLDERPPYHLQMYDGAKKGEQREMIEALDRNDPDVIYWRRDFSQDAVPQAIRSPLVFAYAVEHYVPAFQGPASDVLRPRRREPIPVEYWRSRFGDPFDVGFIPALSDARDAEECTGGAGCVPYAIVRGNSARRGEPITVRFAGGGRTFRVLLRARPGVSDYAVRLDRVWFARFLGPSPEVTAEKAGWTARQVRVRAGDDLY